MISVYPVQFPPSNTPITDQSGNMSNSGMSFFRALYNRTGQGNGLVNQVNTSFSAGGTGATGVPVLTDDWNYVVGANGSNGVTLPSLTGGQLIVIYNSDPLNVLNVYTSAGGLILTQTAASIALFWYFSSDLVVGSQL
jgi:hypothetical protein